jgi:Cu(I)/Ag(I) efflux system membrane protein CusA/SilA
MTLTAVLASLIRSEVIRPIAAPIVGGMITSTIHVLILVPVFFVLMKEGALRRGTLREEQLKQ